MGRKRSGKGFGKDRLTDWERHNIHYITEKEKAVVRARLEIKKRYSSKNQELLDEIARLEQENKVLQTHVEVLKRKLHQAHELNLIDP
jgi:predicted RNase H-like nuclease (RuvC/YqgF family)